MKNPVYERSEIEKITFLSVSPTPVSSKNRESITIIIPAYNEENAITPVLEELDLTLCSQTDLDFKIFVIDDGSTDLTSTKALSTNLKTPLKVVRLSRNFGKEIAMTAGLAEAKASDAVIIMDADGQHPPELIIEFITCWRNGYEDIYGVRKSRDTDNWLKRYLSSWFYKLIPKDSQFIRNNAGDFRLLSSKVVDALNQMPEKNRFMKGLYSWVGYKKFAVPYKVRPRKSGETKFTLNKLVNFAIVGITSFSVLPLRIISRIGIAVSILSFLYGLFIFFRTVFFGIDLPGWATLTVGITALSGIQLVSIGILGEYIGQVFIESKNRPLYFIENVLTKDDMSD